MAKEKLSTCGRCLIFTDITAKQFWGNLRIHYSVEVQPNPKAKSNGGVKNASGSVGNAKPSPKPKKSHQHGQANAPIQNQNVDAQQNQQIQSPSSSMPSVEEVVELQIRQDGNSSTTQSEAPQR